MIRTTSLPAFGKRLKWQRRVCGLKQSALADMMGVAQTTVSRWESGALVPPMALQSQILSRLQQDRCNDTALKRLVEQAPRPVHLIDEVNHACLAYSQARATEWGIGPRAMLGVSLWQFATDEIRAAEQGLDGIGWWDTATPDPIVFRKHQSACDTICIPAGRTLWERLYLTDGTPVRLISSM